MVSDLGLEKDRARYGLLAVVVSNLAIAGVAAFGVWRLGGDRSVIVGVLTAAFTAVSSTTTAYLGIKAVSNTAKSMADAGTRPTPAPTATPTPTPTPAPTAPATPAPAPAPAPAPTTPDEPAVSPEVVAPRTP
ncbi:hypothetical protein [Streptomyces mangrovisoli]|uniref:hypothetical protein n=1 Tax=Streptomyces mangrovisoli TaxID=1428628 RepID=UPI001F0A42F4|nr:hypothetical protein [Streptomyces mangrovisoli]